MSRRSVLWSSIAVLTFVPAVLLTLARVVGAGTGPGVLATAFAPYALPLYLVSLAILLVALARFTAREFVAAGSVLVVLLASVHVVWLAPSFTGAPDGPEPDDPVVAMTLNALFGEADPDEIVTTIVEREVDVVTFQEITQDLLDAIDSRGLSELLPHRAGRVGESAEGTMILSRWPLRDEVDLDLRFASAQVVVDAPQGAFTLVGVHPVRPYLRRATTWATDHERLLDAVRRLSGPLVVAGDLNATPDHVPMRRLRESGLQDTVDRIGGGWQPTWPNGDEWTLLGVSAPLLMAIDHILVTDEVLVHSSTTEAITGTDHRAVIASLSLRTDGAATTRDQHVVRWKTP